MRNHVRQQPRPSIIRCIRSIRPTRATDRPSGQLPGRGPLPLAIVSLRDYNQTLLFLPGAFLFPRAVFGTGGHHVGEQGRLLPSPSRRCRGGAWCPSPRPAASLLALPFGRDTATAWELGATHGGLTIAEAAPGARRFRLDGRQRLALRPLVALPGNRRPRRRRAVRGGREKADGGYHGRAES